MLGTGKIFLQRRIQNTRLDVHSVMIPSCTFDCIKSNASCTVVRAKLDSGKLVKLRNWNKARFNARNIKIFRRTGIQLPLSYSTLSRFFANTIYNTQLR